MLPPVEGLRVLEAEFDRVYGGERESASRNIGIRKVLRVENTHLFTIARYGATPLPASSHPRLASSLNVRASINFLCPRPRVRPGAVGEVPQNTIVQSVLEVRQSPAMLVLAVLASTAYIKCAACLIRLKEFSETSGNGGSTYAEKIVNFKVIQLLSLVSSRWVRMDSAASFACWSYPDVDSATQNGSDRTWALLSFFFFPPRRPTSVPFSQCSLQLLGVLPICGQGAFLSALDGKHFHDGNIPLIYGHRHKKQGFYDAAGVYSLINFPMQDLVTQADFYYRYNSAWRTYRSFLFDRGPPFLPVPSHHVVAPTIDHDTAAAMPSTDYGPTLTLLKSAPSCISTTATDDFPARVSHHEATATTTTADPHDTLFTATTAT
ncbi:hypothetical protein BDZ89DRAFT_1054641 [Hymenopellis radicata]|nr:hypothetical protein BDZ89DRAFT_1054641 [Hymenopellis radicata]